ncbi:MAG: hypothetical protein EXX96DRAFT_566857 [Benjaminiella poitrasii]|nr:MAG: hypothetical protein EXX96DRAFT_566857 [Benjaminiella poitrasii]
MYALLLGKHYTSKNDALDNYEWDQENPRDALNRVAYVLLSQFDPKCILNFCTLQLALSSIINLANEEMKDIMRPCLSGTSIEQRLRDINNDETTIEQMDNEYNCIGKLEDEIFQSLFNEKQKNSEKRRQHALRSINKMKYKYLKNTIDCLELQVLDAYEYILRNINNFEDLNINSNATESDFFNAVYPIISIVIRRTQNLQSRSGDGVCQTTKDALALLKKTFCVQSTQRIYGRKIDLMFIDRKHKAELCSSEWKKRDVSLETLLCQQTKNLRVSKCIFKKIAKLHISLPGLQSLSIDIMDWRGFDGYILQMQRVNGIYLVDINSTVHIPTHVTQIKNFKDSLISLFKWKDRLVELQDIISSAKAVSSSSSSFDGIIKARKRSPSPDDYTFFSPKKSR